LVQTEGKKSSEEIFERGNETETLKTDSVSGILALVLFNGWKL